MQKWLKPLRKVNKNIGRVLRLKDRKYSLYPQYTSLKSVIGPFISGTYSTYKTEKVQQNFVPPPTKDRPPDITHISVLSFRKRTQQNLKKVTIIDG